MPGRVCALAVVFCAYALPAAADESGHWSLQPRTNPVPPRFEDPSDAAWVHNPVDAFVLARLREAGLRPAPPADRRTLIRRLSFDLTGLPPTPDEIEAFLKDTSADACERLVDRLLESPAYGERWAQHWLDVVRYSESEGFEYDRHRPHAWRYRDYVIRSLNDDKPYDVFVREQLCGDEIRPVTREGQIAAGFLRLGPVRRNAGNQLVAFSRNETLTEMTNIVGTVFLGLTVGCARCHDHMFDPIPQQDYYQLQAFLAATHEYDLPLADEAEQARWKAATEALQKEIAAIKESLETASGEEQQRLQQQLAEAEEQLPEPLPAIFSVRNDPEDRSTTHVLKRGNPETPGDAVRPRTLSALGAAELPGPQSGTPRSVLADWIVAADNPLTSRVIVNRVWGYHFGRGIVPTANDLGTNGGRPSHPALLDYLAGWLIEHRWRLKPLHRLLVTSNAYRQSSAGRPGSKESSADPENRLLWRFPPRRLSAEEIRDAMLAVSGQLNPKAGGPSVMVPVDPALVELLYKPSQWQVTPDRSEHNRRSVYLFAKRNLRLPFMKAFDQPDLQTSCARREQSTHPLQSLTLLNGALANRLADALAQRLLRKAGPDPEGQIRRAFELATGRQPTDKELELSLDFLKEQPLREFALAVFNLNDFLRVK